MAAKIKTFEQACKRLKLKPSLPDVSALPEIHQKSIIAFYKLVIIIQALNEGWVPDWSKSSQWKYYNWFAVDADKKRPSGFGFAYSDCTHTRTGTGVGSRLCFKSEQLADYAREQFLDLYKDYLLIS